MQHAPHLCVWMAGEHGIHSRRDALSLAGNTGKRQEETAREKEGSRRMARARLRLERQMAQRPAGPVPACCWLLRPGARVSGPGLGSEKCQGVVDSEPGFYGDVWVKWVGNDLKCLEKKQKGSKKRKKQLARDLEPK